MKTVSLASLLLLAISSSGFGHGVERGAVRAGIKAADLAFLSDSSKEEISRIVEERCNLDGVVSASAEIPEGDSPLLGRTPNGFRIRLRLTMEQNAHPVFILVLANETGFSSNGEEPLLEYSVHSSVCR